jgi:hypothetical protein
MSDTLDKARALLLSGMRIRFLEKPDREALVTLRAAAAEWRDEGRHLTAGYALAEAIWTAWGDGAEVERCLKESLEDLNQCIDTQREDSHEALGALTKGMSELSMHGRGGSAEHSRRMRELRSELARRLELIGAKSTNPCAYMTGGVSLVTDLQSGWRPLLPGETLPLIARDPGDSTMQTTVVLLGPAQGSTPPIRRLLPMKSCWRAAECGAQQTS